MFNGNNVIEVKFVVLIVTEFVYEALIFIVNDCWEVQIGREMFVEKFPELFVITEFNNECEELYTVMFTPVAFVWFEQINLPEMFMNEPEMIVCTDGIAVNVKFNGLIVNV